MKSIRLILAVVFSLFLAACGGGGGSSSANPPTAITSYSISGTVSGATVSGVTVNLTGTSTASTTTDASGNYSFTALANGSYTVTPSQTGFTFNQLSAAVTVSGANVTGTNFTATANAAPTYSLSGTVDALTGVTLTLSGGATATTNSTAGSYTFSGLADATSCTVTPSLAGYTFSPASATVLIASADGTVPNFVATANPVTYSISGTVSGAVTQGVAVTLTGASTLNTITAADGSYSFSGLSNGSYSVVASSAGYTFSPNATAVTLTGADVAGTNFTSSVSVVPTYIVSGAVTGPWVEGLTINMSGDAMGTRTTNASGNYSFSNLPAGSYTFTAGTLAGYSYTTGSATVTTADTAASDIVATSSIASYSITGMVSYAGAKTGGVTVNVAVAGTGFTQWSTHIPVGTGAYIVRGLPVGNYDVTAELDAISNGSANASNPVAASVPVTIAAANLTGVNLSLADPATVTPTTPSFQRISPGDSSAFVVFTTPAASGREIATAYKIYWGTDAATATVGGGSQTIPAQGSNDGGIAYIPGLTNGSVLYFKISALVDAVESAPSAVSGAKTINPTSGGITVTGTVTYGGTATGPLLVGLFNTATASVYYSLIPTPSSPQAFSVAGLPAGTYGHFAVVDNNGNGVPDGGDITNTNGSAAQIAVTADVTSNITLSAADSTQTVTTDYDAQWLQYSLKPVSVDGVKHVVKITMVYGPNVAVPFDTAARNGSDGWVNLAATPVVGDSYGFMVYYADGSSQLVTKSVTGVLGANSAATGLATSAVAPGATATAPQFSWTAPATPPVAYTYSLWLSGPGVTWYMDMPSSQLSVLYNANGAATAAGLSTGVNAWEIHVKDSFGNTARSVTSSY
ncbi:MAG: carboxypeptidase regulatory-like domain-containing protein [Nitrosomonadales bacterium]|nr:carboxypeptidase regulatory-like domain-containing protein [Nitrosomonadales bacterium]